MAAVDFFSSFGYKWGQDGSVYNWDDAQYKQGWATIGSVPPSVEQFNRVHQVADEKASWLYQQIKAVTDNASLTLSAATSDTLLKAIQKSCMLVLPTTPGLQLSSTIYVEDREQILRWKTLGSFAGYVSPQVGCFTWGTTETPRPWEADLIGQTVDRNDPKYTALYWWAQTTGRFIAAGSWTAGTYFFSEMGGTLFRLPDLRNMFIRATGTNLDTANARGLGSKQADALQNATGVIYTRQIDTGAGIPIITPASSGVFQTVVNATSGATAAMAAVTDRGLERTSFDLSRVARTSVESRGTNSAMAPRITL